jgi:Ser/Thr protein kinase RdoA (MazF antagonist)
MSILDYTPAFSLEDAIYFAKKFYTLQGRAEPLPSERDQNFLIQADNGDQFVLKIANATEEPAMLEAQNQVMRHLGKYILPTRSPRRQRKRNHCGQVRKR